MFTSATIKLTAWYLAVLMAMSIIFSLIIFQINYNEIDTRLQKFQQSIVEVAPGIFLKGPSHNDFNIPRQAQTSEAARQLVISLVWINLFVLVAGGIASYVFARRTLGPLEKAHEAQSRFTSDASHELRTPLAAMKTELEVALRDKHISEPESRELLESNLEEVNKLIAISEALLKLSRLDNNALDKEPLDLVELIADAMKRYESDEKRFDIITRKKAPIEANRAAILEVTHILIDNALKYSTKDSRIGIRIYEKRGQVACEIKNLGPQIPQEHITKLFDRFYRLDNSRTRGNENGYGLGLSIAKKIIEAHNGSIQVESSEEYTQFTYFLPLFRKSTAKFNNQSLKS